MNESFGQTWDCDEPDPREEPEERAEMEEFANTIIGPDWREEIPRKELVDFWMLWGQRTDWRANTRFLREWYKFQKNCASENEDEEVVSADELRVLGECIEPTEYLYAAYRKFYEQLNAAKKESHPRKIFSYSEFVSWVQRYKSESPAWLYEKMRMFVTGYEEYRRKLDLREKRGFQQLNAFFKGWSEKTLRKPRKDS